MDADYITLLKEHIDAKIDPLRDHVLELRSDVKELKEFKWKVSAIVIAAGSTTGLAGFGISKVLDKLL